MSSTVKDLLTKTINIILQMQNDNKTLQVSSGSFKARCSAVEKSAASPVMRGDLEGEALVAVFFPPAHRQRINLDCIVMSFFSPLALSMECISQKYLYSVIFNVSISEG